MTQGSAKSQHGLEQLRRKIRQFVDDRDWEQFHSPKNLAMALSVEAAELVEIFQWMTEDESLNLDETAKSHAAEEIGDVLVYLIRISDRLGIDPVTAAEAKMVQNCKKYPAHLAHGNSKKYTEYDN